MSGREGKSMTKSKRFHGRYNVNEGRCVSQCETVVSRGREFAAKVSGIDVIFERLSSIDEDDRHFFVVLGSQLRVGVDIDFGERRAGIAQHLLCFVAEVAAGA